MANSSQKRKDREELIQRRKDVLEISRHAWCRRNDKSHAEFADMLSIYAGKDITPAAIDHWLKRHDSTREMPSELESYWGVITSDSMDLYRPLKRPERIKAQRAVSSIELGTDYRTAWRQA